MSASLRGRVALVTGGGRRVGKAIALALGQAGCDVAFTFFGSEDGADDTAAQMKRLGVRCGGLHADLRDADQPATLIADVVALMGGLDILINSAAVMVRTPFGETSAEQWDDIIALNLRAPFLLSQAAAPQLKARKGQIVNIADLSAFETWPGYIPHGLSKGGIVQLTRALARVLAPDVRVNAVAPGNVLMPEGWTRADMEKLDRTTPLERSGTPDDVVQALLYLLHAEFVTGEILIVDGGRHIRS